MDANTQAKLDEIEGEMDGLGSESDDPESNHLEADNLLCEALVLLGQNQLVDFFRKVAKWYA